MSSLQRYGKQDGNYASLSAAITDASGDTASLIVSQRHAITSSTTLSGMVSVVVNQGGYFNITSGDTLTTIAQHYKISLKTLRNHNRLKSDYIKVGQILTIPTGSGGS